MSVQSNKEVLARAVGALNEGDLAPWFDLHDESVVAHGLLSPEPQDLQGVKGFYTTLVGGLRDFHVTVHDLVGEGDDVSVRFTVTGTHEGDLMGTPASGSSVTVEGISIYRFRAGKIAERWTSADALGLLQQIGAIPAPTPA
jgi:steroid delta-isomerase-like uncharacterized protein